MSNLKMLTSIVAFRDPIPETANPRLRHVDWMRSFSIQDAGNPRSDSYGLAPAETRVIFDGTRTLTVNGNTVFSLSLVPGETINYRIRHTSGTAPGFRTARSFNAVGGAVSLAVNADQTATISITSGSFTGIQAGDTLWLPGAEESVTTPFQLANQGFWLVMTVSALTMVVRRTGDFNGITQSGLVINGNDQMKAFSAAGVQEGDKIELLSGWATANLGTYVIVGVTSSYIDIQSTAKPLAFENTVTPTALGQTVYSSGKRMLYVESDQEVILRINGDAGNLYKVGPWVAGEDPGQFLMTGAVWALTVVNAGQQMANISVISVE
jgi:hypothetical protein